MGLGVKNEEKGGGEDKREKNISLLLDAKYIFFVRGGGGIICFTCIIYKPD